MPQLIPSHYSVVNQNLGFHLPQEKIREIEKTYNAKFLGHWWLRDRKGAYDTRYDYPLDFFFSLDKKNPSKSNYFGIYAHEGRLWHIDAMGTFDITYKGLVDDDGNIFIPVFKEDLLYIEAEEIIDVKMFMGTFIPIGKTEE